MPLYKETNCINFSAPGYKNVVRAGNEIARKINRPVHEVVSEILLTINSKIQNSDSTSQEKNIFYDLDLDLSQLNRVG
jgi:hypothetical protein